MSYQVSVAEVAARPTAVVPATTTWPEFPALWPGLLDEVWGCLRANGITRGCRNIMLYLDGVPHVEVGVLLDQPCPLTGRVVASALPAGRSTGARWEIYGPHDDDPGKVWTEVHFLLAG